MSTRSPLTIFATQFVAAAMLVAYTIMPAIGQATDVTLAAIGDTKVTVADYEASILRIPENDRYGWAMSQERINKEIESLLRTRTIASFAKRKGLDNDPTFKARVALYAERLLAEDVGAAIGIDSAKEFDTKHDIYLERAREQYLTNKEAYQTPPEVKASHILVDLRKRSPEEALAKIKSLRARIDAGEPFEALAETDSDDASAKRNKGSLGFFGRGKMDPAFEAAAFALQKPGAYSEPVRSRFGYHLIRLDDKKPARQRTFEEVSAELMEKLKAQFLDAQRAQFTRSIYDPASIQWNEPAVAGLKKTVDPALYKMLPK